MNLEIDLTLRCQECGGTLDAKMSDRFIGATVVEVEPCEKCVKAAHDKGFDEGLEEGEG